MLRIVELNQGTGNCRGKEQGDGSLPHVLTIECIEIFFSIINLGYNVPKKSIFL